MSAETAAIAALLGMTTNGMRGPNAMSMLSNDKKRSADEMIGSGKPPVTAVPVEYGSGSTCEPSASSEADPSKTSSKRRKKSKLNLIEHSFSVAPRVVQVCKMPKTHVDHSYRDFSSVPPEPDYEHPKDIESMTFSQRLHKVLSTPEYSSIIAWQAHGRAFKILIPRQLEQQKILNRFFGHNRYSTFLSQLKNYGLKQITHGTDVNCYYHEFMLRGLPHLCKYMPPYKEGRKLIADPQNEPDLNTISMLWPVPEKCAAPVASLPKPRETPSVPSVGNSSWSGLLNSSAPSAASINSGLGVNFAGVNSDLSALASLLGARPPRPPAVPKEESMASLLARANFSLGSSFSSQDNVASILARANFSRPSVLSSANSYRANGALTGVISGGLTASTLAALLNQSGTGGL